MAIFAAPGLANSPKTLRCAPMTTKYDHSRFRAEPFNVQSAEVLSELKRLSVAAGQEEFGGTFAETLEEWQAADKKLAQGLIFFFDEALAGCVLLKHPPGIPKLGATRGHLDPRP